MLRVLASCLLSPAPRLQAVRLPLWSVVRSVTGAESGLIQLWYDSPLPDSDGFDSSEWQVLVAAVGVPIDVSGLAFVGTVTGPLAGQYAHVYVPAGLLENLSPSEMTRE